MIDLIHKITNNKQGIVSLLAMAFLLIADGIIAQSGNKLSNAQEFELLVPRSPEEKLFIHTAKTFYLPGEIIWFKIYVTDPVQNRPSLISKVAYAELLDVSNKALLQAKIGLDSGSGNGSLVVPAYLPTGQYTLRAYTNLIKNYDPSTYFHQSITIINPAKTNEPLQGAASDANYVAFFPEGGQLVTGLLNNVAFKFTNQFGKGIQGSGILINQQNDTIVRFVPLKFGMGRFAFTPIAGNSYKALITFPGKKTIPYPIPDIIPRGYSFQLTEKNPTQLSLDIHTNNDPASHQVYLVAHAHNIIRTAMAIELIDGRASILINKKDLPDGISLFTLFDKNKDAVAERSYFKKPYSQLLVSVNMGRQEYGHRTKIAPFITSTDGNGSPVAADLSIAVFLLDSLQNQSAADIRSYLWMGSEIKGFIESPDYYFTGTGSENTTAIDNLMLTQGWRRLLPSSSVKKPILDIPEYAGHIINGRIVNKYTGKPAKGIISFLSVPGDRFHFSNCRSDDNGRIHFDCKKIIGTENIIVQTNKETDSIYRIEIDNPFSTKYQPLEVAPLNISEKWQNQLLSRITHTQLQNAFTNTKLQQFYLPNFSDTTPFFGKPDNVYLLDDYTRFYTMEEVLREYVSEIQVRKSQGNYRLKMLNLPYSAFFEDNPLLLLDGVPVFDVNKMIAFDPLKIKKLDIVSRRYFQGAVSYEGIANFRTYQGDLAGFQMDPNAVIIEYEGLQLQRQFYSPQYETANQVKKRIPDFRNLLYWSPDLKTNKDGKQQIVFYSGDIPGNYALVVQGISASGEAGFTVNQVKVNK